MPFLLFPEEIPVSEAEVQAWLNSIPNLSAAKHRREAYRKAYNVEEKIRVLKAKGEWFAHSANKNNR